MSYLAVLLEGENFFIEFEGKEQLLGFVTTRWVKAVDEQQAELKAVELIKNDSYIQSSLRSPENEVPKPMIYMREMYKVNWFTYFRRQPGAGYTFYSMGAE